MRCGHVSARVLSIGSQCQCSTALARCCTTAWPEQTSLRPCVLAVNG